MIWKHINVQPWLEANAKYVYQRVNAKDPFIEECKRERKRRYTVPVRPALRHVILADFKQKVPLTKFLSPADEPILAFDPLPPKATVNFSKK